MMKASGPLFALMKRVHKNRAGRELTLHPLIAGAGEMMILPCVNDQGRSTLPFPWRSEAIEVRSAISVKSVMEFICTIVTNSLDVVKIKVEKSMLIDRLQQANPFEYCTHTMSGLELDKYVQFSAGATFAAVGSAEDDVRRAHTQC